MDINNELQDLEGIIKDAKRRAAEIVAAQDQRAKEISQAAAFVGQKGSAIDNQEFLDFFKKPYAVIPYTKNSVLVVVPKFVKGFQVGWLWKELDNFYIYQFDQYSAWLGDAPRDLLDQIGFEETINAKIDGNVISFDRKEREIIKKKLGHHLRDVEDTQAIIKKGHEFDVIADTIKAGCLPFRAMPVADADRRPVSHGFTLRPYQAQAIKKFLETGAVGVFHPTGAGKSFTAMHAMDMIKGQKIIVVPTVTLVEHWWHYIETHAPHLKREIRIFTYSGFRDYNARPSLIIFDECQRLPADTFSRLAVVPAKYRMGLSASPHREDGRENYIFALTGFPIGLNWQEYMKTVGKKYHPIYVHTVKSAVGKMRKLEEILDRKKKTMIFCDTIALGKEISKRLEVPYIYGESTDRLSQIAEHKVIAVSRVADLGVSVKDLQRIIEIDFLFGSRQQELQRTGRLMHSEVAERHDIIMTEAELRDHGKRLWALQEKGFTIKVL